MTTFTFGMIVGALWLVSLVVAYRVGEVKAIDHLYDDVDLQKLSSEEIAALARASKIVTDQYRERIRKCPKQ